MFRKFLKAFGSFSDMGAAGYDFPKIKSVAEAFRADKQKMAGDWKKLGGDLSNVIKKEIDQETFEKLNQLKK